MEKLKLKADYLQKVKKRKDPKKTTVAPWQEFAVEVCQEFGIKPPYHNRIFQLAKNSKHFLQRVVENVKAGNVYNNEPNKSKLGPYLCGAIKNELKNK